MIRSKKGITLIVLVITIIVMVIIASTVISISMDRFQVNDARKLINDLELLQEKVSNYNLKYESLPVVRDSSGIEQKYTKTLNFETDSGDSDTYYIIDLEALGNLSLNYGEGYKDPNNSNDLYIINEKTHIIYYVKGIEFEGETQYYIGTSGTTTDDKDNIPPSNPEIKVISGAKAENGTYITSVKVEIVPGKDSWSGVSTTTYTVNNGTAKTISSSDIYDITESGTYIFKAQTKDEAGNVSEATLTVTVSTTHEWDEGIVVKAATCTEKGTMQYTCTTCGKIITGEIEALSHVEDGGKITKKNTCTETGTYTYYCVNCGIELRTRTLGKLNHVESTYKITKQPTTSSTGTGTWYCTCGAVVRTVTLAKLSSGGNTVGNTVGGGSSDDEETLCELYGHAINYNEFPDEQYKQCEHTHVAIWKCSRSGCEYEKVEAFGHYASYPDLWDYGKNILGQRIGEYICSCGHSAAVTGTEIMNYLERYYPLYPSTLYTYADAGYNMWHNVWKSRCDCSLSVRPE